MNTSEKQEKEDFIETKETLLEKAAHEMYVDSKKYKLPLQILGFIMSVLLIMWVYNSLTGMR